MFKFPPQRLYLVHMHSQNVIFVCAVITQSMNAVMTNTYMSQ